MKSLLTEPFLKQYRKLPEEIRNLARKNYQLWSADPSHRSLQFKKVSPSQPIWSVRVGDNYRAVGAITDNTIHWFFIGSHAEYDHLLRQR